MPEITLHCQVVPGWIPEWVNALGVKYIKVIDPPERPFCSARVIGRTFMPDGDSNHLIWKGKAGAIEWFNHWRDIYASRRYVFAWEGPNEPQPIADLAFRKVLSEFTFKWNRMMHIAGYKTVAYNLSVGGPDIGHAPDLWAGLSNADFLGLHEYSAPAMWDGQGWYCNRYRRTIAELKGHRVPPILITECGIDGMTLNQPYRGWRTYAKDQCHIQDDGASAEDIYLKQLSWYLDEISKDKLVIAAFVFTAGPCHPWWDFEVGEDLAMRFPKPRWPRGKKVGHALLSEV